MKFLVGADYPPDPNSGAAGTVHWTNRALRELGHEVDEFGRADMPHRIRHGNLHYLLELPSAYREAVQARCARKEYDIIMLSQPHAWLAARDHLRRRRQGVFLDRSHGLESMANQAVARGRQDLHLPENRFPRSLASAAMRHLLERHVRLVARYSQGLVVPAADIRDYLMAQLQVPEDRIAVIHHGVHPRFAAVPAAPMTADRLRKLLYVGQFAFFKAPHVLAAAAQRLLVQHPDMTLTWVCDRSAQPQAAGLIPAPIRAQVRFVDWLPQESLLDLYDQHGLFLFPSFYEGAGKACLEAMSRGLCVVASDVGAMRDYIQDGSSGRLVPAGDVDALVAGVNGFGNDLDRAIACSGAARARARDFTWSRCAAQIADFARDLLRRGR